MSFERPQGFGLPRLRDRIPAMIWTVRIAAVLLAGCSCGIMAQNKTPTSNVTSGNVVASNNYVIDDFKDGDISSNPTWWVFGDMAVSVGPNSDAKESDYVGRQSLRFQGKSKNHYVGGVGTYLALDGTRFNAIDMIVCGAGRESGRVKIELYDDDNKNYIIEPSPFVPGRVAFDDRFIYEFPINWEGWKKVTIPLSMFYDDNPKIGDDIWNPDHKNGSGGLVQIQLIASTTNRKGKIDFKLDSIRLFMDPQIKVEMPAGAEILNESPDENLDYNIQPGR